ncbi:MAG TPA: 4-hydroxy-tetrahydrodipicolinate reductase [Methylomusa anaerophila]|uniref:4-hydroxy-tetrahydrodipicolinate reductase n=1 Tax=Methylomusa anaerophila TaxID=1930071 RepID=A0A348APX5_9FIRM|nr:4-hydroxy-tetrahydrodipicolinate reductase [Methylomusa anaerophila]BBB93123.1 4-hydroxy-tetrahydrodipicolinate reductase [Methylomusa anaerophila]HML87044.1 4-hydroxy-tetrahydrodipicolinate reductase [Methylomusa anaerophila]
MIRVLVCGAYGKMGREVLKAVHKDEHLSIVGAVDLKSDFNDVGDIIGAGKTGVIVGNDLSMVINETKPQVMVDFTNPEAVMNNIRIAINNGVCPVVGTTGLSEEDLQEVRDLCEYTKVNAIISPNFSIGAILMMRLAQEAVKYLPQVEIIELHHDQKLDAPSGTALRTAELIAQVRGTLRQGHPDEFEKLAGARGSELAGIRVHSVRLPGYVAHQEVIFGGLGQTLTIRHDSISRESFMPGVTLACKRILTIDGLVYGLENILD